MKFFIGTSGYQYKHWNNGAFYPAGVTDHLSYIYQHLNCVEINSSHYSIPKPETVANWASKVPDGSKLVLKTPRSVSHRRRLALESDNLDVKPGIDLMEYFLEGVNVIPEGKRGPVLVQVSDRMMCDLGRLEDVLSLVRYHGCRVAFEARHESWFKKPTFDLLEKYNSALVAHDWSKYKCPIVTTADFLYMRKHGPKDMYTGDYTDEMLDADIRNLRLQECKEAYVFFNNDGNACAPKNAIRMLQLVENGSKSWENVRVQRIC